MERMRISGLLGPGNQLRLKPAYSSEPTQRRRAPAREPAGAYAETLGAEGNVLTRSPLRLIPLSDSPSRILKGLVELHPAMTTLVISLRDSSGGALIEIGRYKIPAEVPGVEILEQPKTRVAGRQRISWATRGATAAVEFLVDYSWDGGLSWQPASHRLKGTECDIDFDQLPGGEKCVIAISASNGFTSATVMCGPFQVAIKPCRAIIAVPVAGQNAPTETTLIGNGYWLEEALIELKQLRWLSNIDGELGEGNSVPVRLSPGKHEITLIAGSAGREGRQTVEILVRDDG